MQLVNVTNKGKQPLVLNGNERIVLQPNKTTVIPFATACGWFGDPRARNVGKEKTRADIYRQVQQLWGFVEGIAYHDDEGNLQTWEDRKPEIEATDQDGNPIIFVMDDPLGERALDGEIVDPSSQSADQLRSQVAQLEEQLAKAMALISQVTDQQVQTNERLDAAEAHSSTELPKADASTAGAADDTPRTTKVGGRSK